jgi:hypothetical protein
MHNDYKDRPMVTIIRFLLILILAEIAMVGGALSVAGALNVWDAYKWRQEAIMANWERNECQTKHRILVESIRKEGLWRRMGMPGQPWLN